MRHLKLLALSFAVILASSGSAFAINQPTDPGELKSVRGQDQATASKVYKLVRYVRNGANDVSVVSGDVLVYSITSDDGVSVNLTTTSGDVAIAGIAVTAIPSSDSIVGTTAADDIGRRNWGYMQVHGPALANITAAGFSGGTVGEGFITSTDAGKIAGIQDGATTNGTDSGRQAMANGGIVLDTPAATDTSVEVFIRLE